MEEKDDSGVEELTEQYREKSPKKLPLSDVVGAKEFIESQSLFDANGDINV